MMSFTQTYGSPILNAPEPEKPFEEPWQAQAFAMVVDLHQRGKFTWSEWADTLGAVIKSEPTRPYYESWLAALEQITEIKKLIGHEERHERIEAWDRAAHATPHGQPILLENGEH
jgi:nitrile hydratase accessory protein